MADLAAQPIPLSGLAPTYASASGGGDTAPIGPKLVLHVKNDSGGTVTVNVPTSGTVGDLAIADVARAVPAAGDAFIPLTSTLRNLATGRAAITYTATTSVTAAVLQLP